MLPERDSSDYTNPDALLSIQHEPPNRGINVVTSVRGGNNHAHKESKRRLEDCLVFHR